MKKQENLQNNLLTALGNHKNLLVYYGENDNDPEEIYFDEEIQKYRGWLGIWSMELLLETAKGEVENIYLEVK